jgi:hypothetical protein
MKRRLPVILVLLFAAALVAVAVFTLSPPTRQSVRAALGATTSASKGPAVAGRNGSTPGGDGASQASAAQNLALRDVASRLMSGDLKDVVANLRAAGFPPAIVRAIVAAALDEQFAARRRKILGDQPVPPYWKAGSMLSLATSSQYSELRALAREEQDALKQLLGPDSATSEMQRFLGQRMYGDLPQDKIDAMGRIRQDYNDLRNQVYAEAGGTYLPSDREKLAMLEQEQRADMAAVLTPEELRQYDLRSSNTANRLQTQLTAFNPTEQEYVAIYDLQNQFDQKYNMMGFGGMPTQEQMAQRQVDQKQVQEQIKAALGDQRYLEYQQATDSGYQAASRIASSLQLPPQNAVAVYNLQQSIQQQATAIRSARDVPAAERMQQAAALAAQAQQQLTSLLTAQGLETYRQTSGGSWLRGLEMATRRPGSTTGTTTTTGSGRP